MTNERITAKELNCKLEREQEEKMTAEDLDKEFDKFWNGAYSEDWFGSRVYAHVDKGTARALFLEGWVRHEVWAYAKEEAEKYVKEKKENHD